jgi:hypothetical protein
MLRLETRVKRGNTRKEGMSNLNNLPRCRVWLAERVPKLGSDIDTCHLNLDFSTCCTLISSFNTLS